MKPTTADYIDQLHAELDRLFMLQMVGLACFAITIALVCYLLFFAKGDEG